MGDEPRPFAGWRQPDGYQLVNLARCRGCGAAIAWAVTAAGRTAPLDRDGTSHFATCPQAATFRRRSALR